jgi:hypothetical protein
LLKTTSRFRFLDLEDASDVEDAEAVVVVLPPTVSPSGAGEPPGCSRTLLVTTFGDWLRSNVSSILL